MKKIVFTAQVVLSSCLLVVMTLPGNGVAQEKGVPTLAPVETEVAADKPAAQAADKPTDKPVKEPADKPVKEPADKPVKEPADKSVKEPADKSVKEPADQPMPRKASEIDIDELLRQLETVIRDPFSPDPAIVREQKKARGEFVELVSPQELPEISLVAYAESGKGDDTERLVGLKIDGRVYFVRKNDRVTLPRASGNLVIEITSIDMGFVEVTVGTLAESLIIR